MGQLQIREEAGTPATPSQGVILYPTVATPSILKLVDDAGNVYTLMLVEKAQTLTGANTFATVQTIAPVSTGVDGLVINMPASTAGYAEKWQYNSVGRINVLLQSAVSLLDLSAYDAGNGAIAPQVRVGRNNNGTGPAAGCLALSARDGTLCYFWVDNTANFRISTGGAPTNATDTSGVVVGTQTSSRAFKNILGAATNPAQALKNIVEAGRRALRRFTYKSGAYGGQEFEGIIVEEAPRYGMDRDAEHPAGKSLNEITLLSDLVGAIVALTERLEALEAKQNG